MCVCSRGYDTRNDLREFRPLSSEKQSSLTAAKTHSTALLPPLLACIRSLHWPVATVHVSLLSLPSVILLRFLGPAVLPLASSEAGPLVKLGSYSLPSRVTAASGPSTTRTKSSLSRVLPGVAGCEDAPPEAMSRPSGCVVGGRFSFVAMTSSSLATRVFVSLKSSRRGPSRRKWILLDSLAISSTSSAGLSST